ncbi:MAG: HAD family hydrolase [Clostridia bacterium]|nr:HAD family hydrolase [Clostridia bacterium]
MKHLKWIFFDIGGTLVDETESFRRRVQQTIAMQEAIGNHYTETELEAAMRASALAGGSYFRGAMKNIGLSPFAPYDCLGERLYPDAKAVLEELSGRYSLGIIANQPMGTEGRLSAYGIRAYFSLVLSSAEEGLEKPDEALFLRALDRAKCAPEEAMMVGDRPDNDILPAKRLGMKTVRITQGLGGIMPVKNEEMRADFTIGNLSELIGICK